MIQLQVIDETSETTPVVENNSSATSTTRSIDDSSHHCLCHHHHQHHHDHQALLKEEEPCVMVAERNEDVESGLANPLDCYPPGAASSPLTFVQIHHLIEDIHEYGLLDVKMNRLLIYIFSILLYIGLNAALLGANFQEQTFIEEHYYIPFHMADFWGLFGFTLLEALLLIVTEIVSVDNIFQTGLIFFNIVITFVAAFLFTLDPKFYEVPSHYIAYSIQVLITGVNVIFLRSYMKTAKPDNMVYRLRHVEVGVAISVVLFSIFQLVLYSGVIPVNMGSERSAHFCEFSNEIVNAFFALTYALLTYWDIRKLWLQHYETMKHPFRPARGKLIQ